MRVVIAEDLILLREGVAWMLTASGFDVVAQVGDAGALVSAVVEHRPDLVVADVRMPPDFIDEGARAVMLLRERYPDLAVLVLSHIVDPELALTLLQGRPSSFGYLLKDRVAEVDDFLEAVSRVTAGDTVVDPQVVEQVMHRAGDRLAILSARERDVLTGVARGLSNARIAAELFVSERTVDAHLRSIFAKLDMPPSADDNRRVRVALTWLGRGA